MLIVLLDESRLFVYPSPEAASGDIEPPDAETEVRAAFDEHAVPYRVEWIRPNRTRKWFGLFSTISFGEYRWVVAGPPDPAAFVRLVEEHPTTNPPEAKHQLNSFVSVLRGL